MKTMFAGPLSVALAVAPLASASATIVSTLDNGTSVAIPVVAGDDYSYSRGPITFGPGITFTSSSRTLFGLTAEFGFAPGVLWSGTPMIGLDTTSGSFTLSFATPLSGFLAEINSTEYANWDRDAVISAYDAEGNLLDSLLFERQGYQVEPGYWGFSYASAQIARITFSNEYIGIRNISVVLPVPEPASWGLMIAGFALVGGALRRSGRTRVMARA
jgi:hypothetical protein